MRARRARQQGLEDRVEFIEDDYRNISGALRCVRVGRHARARRASKIIRNWGDWCGVR